MESHASDLVAVVDGLGIERTRLVGMSLGGMVTCEFALCHPDRTESLAMVDVVSRPLFATARMRSFMAGFRGAATVEEVVEMALAVDPERLSYGMRALLKRGDEGTWCGSATSATVVRRISPCSWSI